LSLAELTEIDQRGPSHNLRLKTLINVRWLAILGQSSKIRFRFYYWFPL